MPIYRDCEIFQDSEEKFKVVLLILRVHLVSLLVFLYIFRGKVTTSIFSPQPYNKVSMLKMSTKNLKKNILFENSPSPQWYIVIPAQGHPSLYTIYYKKAYKKLQVGT